MLHAGTGGVSQRTMNIEQDAINFSNGHVANVSLDIGEGGLAMAAAAGAVQPLAAPQTVKNPAGAIERTANAPLKGRPGGSGIRRNEARQKMQTVQTKKLKQSVKSNKMSTGKYDMFVLRELAKTEEAALKELVAMYKVETEDELPVTFDIHEIVDMDVSDRRAHLAALLGKCPSAGTEAFIEKYVERINELNPHL